MESLLPDFITLDDLAFDTVIGILPSEQVSTQPMVMTVRMAVDFEACGRSGDLGQSIDYASIADQLVFLAQHGRFRLIETLVIAQAGAILAMPDRSEDRASVSSVTLTFRKPTILGGLAVPGVQFTRDAGWFAPETKLLDDGTAIQTLVDDTISAAYRIVLPTDGVLQPPPGVALMPLSPGLFAGDSPMAPVIARASGPILAPAGGVLLAAGNPVAI